MQQTQAIVGLDVGSTKIAAVVGTISEGLTQIVGVAQVPSAGVRKGVVTDIEECVSAISNVIEQVERMAGIPLTQAIVAIGGSQVGVTMSKGVIAVSRPDGEITQLDVDRVIDAARAVAMPPNREIVHVIPKYFLVDGQESAKDPVGMTGVRLETEALVIGVATSALRNLTKSITQSGIGIDSLIFSPLATSEGLLTKSQKEAGVIMIDLGGATTGIAIYEEGSLIHSTIIPVGSTHITNDLAIGLKTSIEIAERIKLEYGTATSDQVKEGSTIDMSKYDSSDNQKIKITDVAEIIEARLKEIFEHIADELKSIGKDSLLPGGVILTGGGSLLNGIVVATKNELHLPVRHGTLSVELAGMVDKIESPVYAASVGLMLSGIMQSTPGASSKLNFNMPQSLLGITQKAKDLLKQFLP